MIEDSIFVWKIIFRCLWRWFRYWQNLWLIYTLQKTITSIADGFFNFCSANWNRGHLLTPIWRSYNIYSSISSQWTWQEYRYYLTVTNKSKYIIDNNSISSSFLYYPSFLLLLTNEYINSNLTAHIYRQYIIRTNDRNMYHYILSPRLIRTPVRKYKDYSY